MPTKRQLSFAKGEIAPAVQSRIDMTAYATGLNTCLNWVVMRHGGLINRAGTGFIAEVKDSSKTIRQIPFIFNNDQTYVLEFGDLYMRVIRDGAQVLETAQAITSVSTPGVGSTIGIVGHGFLDGEEVSIADVGGMTELNGRNFKVANKTTDTFDLQEMDGTTLDTSLYTAWTSGGTAARVYTITTPYVVADLPALEFIQSADVMTLTHLSYAPRELARTGHTAWMLSTIVNGAQIGIPQNVANSSSGTAEYYKVTAVDAITGEESLPSAAVGSTVKTAITSWDGVEGAGYYNVYRWQNGVYGWIGSAFPDIKGFTPVSITSATWAAGVVTIETSGAHGYSSDDFIEIDGADQDGYNGIYKITVTDGTHFTYAVANTLTTPATGTITATETLSQFDDNTYTVDLLDQPPIKRLPFDGIGNYPATCAYFQQRRVFANTNNDPELVEASKSTLAKNFMKSSPIQDDDPVSFSLAGRRVNAVQHLLELGGRLVLFTSSGEWSIKGNTAGILTPTGVNPDQHTGHGTGILRPLEIDGTALYVQERGSKVRDIGYKFESDGYHGDEVSIFASHLVDGHTIVDWDYQENPHSIAWAVRDDGVLLGLTYLKEHEIRGWHRHSFENGLVENICVIPEGNEDAVYLTIKRTINGKVVRYIERMKERLVTLLEDNVIVDSSLSYDGRNTDTAWTMTVSGGTTWKYTEDLTMTSNTASAFASTDIGNSIVIDNLRFFIKAYTSDTIVTVRAERTVPVPLRGVATSSWAKGVLQVGGLWHLEGQNISAFVDGYASANPNNDAYEIKTVTNGIVTFADPHAVIHVGLPITADIEMLDMDDLRAETLSDKKKLINKVTLRVENTLGLFVGANEDNLIEFKMRDQESLNMPIDPETGNIIVGIPGEWNGNGRFIVRQTDPLPASILSVMPAGYTTGG